MAERPEILAPAGDPTALRAALAAGADAVYLGMARFNARGRAERFRDLTLTSCVNAAHDAGARVHVTLNTLIHDDELPGAIALAEEAVAAGVDAVIVQDLGFARILRERFPDLPLHGSTQQTIHNPEQACEAVRLLGLERVIVARECSVEEIRAIRDAVEPFGADVEVFVHGALCFAYSGQCLMSNFAGRRSANRGLCAQNCRFDFAASEPTSERCVELPVFSRARGTQLISMKDLAAFDAIAALADAGVGSFKIEGRLKGPEYVGEIVRLYREALDRWQARAPLDAEEALDRERAARRVYSRGFTNGYLRGEIDASMRGDKRLLEGEPDAHVVSADRHRGVVVIAPRAGHSILPGQGYAYAHDRYRGGFRVLSVEFVPAPRGSSDVLRQVRAQVRFGSDASGRRFRRGARGRKAAPPPLPAGLPLFLNDDPEIGARTQELLSRIDIGPEPRLALTIEASGTIGSPLRLRGELPDGIDVEAESESPLLPARSRPLDESTLTEHLGRLGETDYVLAAVGSSDLASDAFLPLAELHATRRRLVDALDAARRSRAKAKVRTAGERLAREVRTDERRPIALVVSVGSIDAARVAIESGASRIVVDAAALRSACASLSTSDDAISSSLADRLTARLPPIAHDAEAEIERIESIRDSFPGIRFLAGHLGQLALLRARGLRAEADLYLNAYNAWSLDVLRQAGACAATLSLEVEAKEAAKVARHASPEIGIEVVVGGRVFSMLTRQDYGIESDRRFAAVSEHSHPYVFERLPGEVSGTVLWEARELVGARALPELAGAVDAVRLELFHQPVEAIAEITRAYRAAIDALESGASADAEDPSPRIGLALEAHLRHAPHGWFEGHLFRGARRFDRVESAE